METMEIVRDVTPKYAGQRMDKAHFMRWESDDEFVYEWSDGILEPTTSMKQEEIFITRNILKAFRNTALYQQDALLLEEIDCWLTDKQMRRPDLSLYTDEQIKRTAMGARVVPAFVIELLSEFDDIMKVEKKLLEYFQAGVQVVWWVFPPYRKVHVYTSPKSVVIATDTDSISAAPAIPDLVMKTNDVFQI